MKNKLDEMEVLDSYMSLRLLKDLSTGFYVVLDLRNMNTHYAKDQDLARQFFDKRAEEIDNEE